MASKLSTIGIAVRVVAKGIHGIEDQVYDRENGRRKHPRERDYTTRKINPKTCNDEEESPSFDHHRQCRN